MDNYGDTGANENASIPLSWGIWHPRAKYPREMEPPSKIR